MGAAAPIGAGAYLAGTAANAWGQHEATQALRNVWANATAQQRGYDQQLAAKAGQMVDQVNPQAVLGAPAQQAAQAAMDASSKNAAGAVQKQITRKPGNVEGNAVAAQRMSGTLARAIQDGHLQSILAGLQSGGQNIDMLGRRYGLDASRIRGDSQQAASLVPMFERAAAMHGSEWRQLGQLGQMGGMAGIMAGLSAAPGASTAGGMAADSGGVSGMTAAGPYDYVGASPTYWQMQPGAV